MTKSPKIETDLIALKDKYPDLSDRERRYLVVYQKEEFRPLAVTLQAQCFELYLHGKTCEEIGNLNPNIPLGGIVLACIEGGWIERRQEHIYSLMKGIQQRVEQTQLESINFIADGLAAAHKYQIQKVMAFIQGGDEKDFDRTWFASFKHYKEAWELLYRLTGQESGKDPGKKLFPGFKRRDSPSFNAQEGGCAEPEVSIEGTWTEEKAARILKVMEEEGDGEG